MPNTNTINQESVDKIVDAILCVGVPYMNEGWAKFPKEHTQMLDGFKATKGYKEAREQIKKLLVEAFKHGLVTGAMPEALGKPIAQDYIAQLNQHKYV